MKLTLEIVGLAGLFIAGLKTKDFWYTLVAALGMGLWLAGRVL